MISMKRYPYILAAFFLRKKTKADEKLSKEDEQKLRTSWNFREWNAQ